MNRLKHFSIVGWIIAAIILFLRYHTLYAADSPYAYFGALDYELKKNGIARPVVILDLDRVDHNLDEVMKRLPPPLNFRVVDKSLPSVELLKYILARTHTNRVMTFHHPFLKTLLIELGPGIDYLYGKPIPIDGVKEVMASLDAGQKARALRQVTWLIDTPERMVQYIDYFKANGWQFNASVEIDVGLKRGGAETLAEFDRILALIVKNPRIVNFTGLMGYDGHVSHFPAPALFSLKKKAMAFAHRRVQKRYRVFTAHLKENYPLLYAKARVTNGGGSTTYSMYRPGGPINDISLGSAIVKPADFDTPTLTSHLPAVFIATPVLKKQRIAKMPFIGRIAYFSKAAGYYVYGGGWSDHIVHPKGIDSFFLSHPAPNRNLVPNQSYYFGVASPDISVGDFVFFRPDEGDAILGFETIHLLRGGKLIGTWKPFESRL